MKILVLGSGLIGPAVAYNALCDRKVKQVTLCDMDEGQLDAARARLAHLGHVDRLATVQLDLHDRAAASELMAQHDVVLAALPNTAIPMGLAAAIAAQRPWVDLSWLPQSQAESLRPEVESAGIAVIFGCGVEPGLTEIMARRVAQGLDEVEELHIKCGGIPEKPTPPLGYKIVFGGRRLPLYEQDALEVEDGALKRVPRYSGAETVFFDGVGECEAWHEGFMPWLLDLKKLKRLKRGTQKTVRWPGFAAKATLLREMGLLSNQPVDVDGVAVAPKRLLDALLYPRVKLDEHDRDITALRVEAIGVRKGRWRRLVVEMIDRFDETTGFTSMARVTAFTGAIVARMVARGDIKATGLLTPEKVIKGKLFQRLVDELAAENIRFTMTTERTRDLD